MTVIVGPRIMKNREAFNLKLVLVVYNLGLVILSIYMLCEVRTVYPTHAVNCSEFLGLTRMYPKQIHERFKNNIFNSHSSITTPTSLPNIFQ